MLGGELKEPLDNREGTAERIVLADEALRLEPDIFNGILLGCIGCKTQTSDAPVVWVVTLVDCFEKGLDFLGAMIASAIPKQGNASVWALLQEILQERNRRSGIPFFVRLDETFAGD